MRTAEIVVGAGGEHAAAETDVRAALLDEARRLWVAALSFKWRVLAVVPVNQRLGAVEVARGVHRVGVCEAGIPLRFVNGAGVDLAGSTQLARELEEHVDHGGGAVVVVDPPAVSASAVPLLLGTDAVVLAVQLGRTTRAEVAQTLEQLGGRKVIGAVLVGGGR
jgi:hypothetical protein